MRVIYYGAVPKPIPVELEEEFDVMILEDKEQCQASLDIAPYLNRKAQLRMPCGRVQGHSGMHVYHKPHEIIAEWED